MTSQRITFRTLCLFAFSALMLASCSQNIVEPAPDNAALSGDEAPSKSTPKGEIQWIDPKKLQPGPIQRDKLTDEQMARIKLLQKTFFEVGGQSVDQWVDNFKRDIDPDRELASWERMAKAYNAYCRQRDLELVAKKEVFKVVLLRSMASQEDVLQRLELKVISKDDAIEIMKGY